ncbi:MAG: YHS domain-containing protein [Sedimentisphaerales bacterium]|nr:YHS domain-containing protein [Sedimentisphaerales bacterium]
MKVKGLMLLTVAVLAAACVLVGCKKKEQPAALPKAPAMEDVQKAAEAVAAKAEDAKTELDRTIKEAEEAIKKMEAEAAQTMCPVMDGNPIDPNVFVEYQGSKVYFCCPACKAKFESAPEKYTANLPQFQK